MYIYIYTYIYIYIYIYGDIVDTFKIKMSFYEDLEIAKGLIMSELLKKLNYLCFP